MGELRLAGEEIAPAPERLVDAHELAQRVDVALVEGDDLREHRDESGVALDLVAVHARDLAEHREASGRVVGARVLEVLAQQLDEGVPPLGLRVEPLERGARLGVRRLVAQDRLVLVDRLLRLVAGLCELGDLGRERGLLGPLGERALRVDEHRHEPLRVARLAAALAEEVEHAGVRRVRAPQALEPGLGRGGVAAHARVHHRDLEDHARLFAGADASAAELILVQGDEVVPLLLVGEVLREEAHRVALARPEIEHALVGRHRSRLCCEPVGRRATEPQQGRDAVLLAGRVVGQKLRDARDVFPRAVGAVHALEQHRCAHVARVGGERRLEPRHDLGSGCGVGARVPVGEVGGRSEARALGRRVAGPGRLGVELAHALLPGGGCGVEARERAARVGVVGACGEEGLVGGPGPREVAELLVEHARELPLHREADGRAGGERDLELEHPRDGVPLAPQLVASARRFEQRFTLLERQPAGGRRRVGQLGPSVFAIGLLLEPAESSPDVLRAHRLPWRAGVSPARRGERSAVWPRTPRKHLGKSASCVRCGRARTRQCTRRPRPCTRGVKAAFRGQAEEA